jgi:hypothetical protein
VFKRLNTVPYAYEEHVASIEILLSVCGQNIVCHITPCLIPMGLLPTVTDPVRFLGTFLPNTVLSRLIIHGSSSKRPM